jgi:hypothetical protein
MRPTNNSTRNDFDVLELAGHEVTANLGIVRGIGQYRRESVNRMLEHAAEKGAGRSGGRRYDATELMQCVTEVLCYGTAVKIKTT